MRLRPPAPLLAAVATLAAAAALAQAPAARQPTIDPKAHPSLNALLAQLQSGSEASRYCAQTGGLYLEADALLRQNLSERDAVEAIVARGREKLAVAEVKRLREIAVNVTSLAAGFRQLAPESTAIAYAQTCLASARQAVGTRSQQELTDRYAAALSCDKRHAPGSVDGKECVARAFAWR